MRNLLVGARLAVGGTNKAMMTRYFKNEEKPQVVPTDEQAEDLGEAPAAIPGETEADAEPKVDVPLTELPSPSRSWAPQTQSRSSRRSWHARRQISGGLAQELARERVARGEAVCNTCRA